MNNKKGKIRFEFIAPMILFIVLGGFFLFCVIGMLYLVRQDSQIDTCKIYRNLKLESVNGVYDKDTGLFSGGSISEKTLLFENRLILTLKNYEVKEVDLILGKEYDIKKCKMKSDRITYEVLK